jgi:hypothetical protein
VELRDLLMKAFDVESYRSVGLASSTGARHRDLGSRSVMRFRNGDAVIESVAGA